MSKSTDNTGAQGGVLSVLRDSVRAYWQQRDARERRMLLLGLTVVVLGFVYGVLIDPALSGRAKLKAQIPQLRLQAARMDALAKQSTELSSLNAENIAPVSREMVESGLTRRSVKIQSISVNDDIVRLQLGTVAYGNLMEWLLEVQKTARLTVEDAKLTALPEPGMVEAVLTLKQQRNAS
jgi:general secretion pathway protein M